MVDSDKRKQVQTLARAAYASDQRGEQAAAIADYTRAIALDPNNATLWFGRGLVKSRAGDHAGAISDYDKALSLLDEGKYKGI